MILLLFSYLATTADTYVMVVKVDGDAIVGSPFHPSVDPGIIRNLSITIRIISHTYVWTCIPHFLILICCCCCCFHIQLTSQYN